MSTGKKSQEEKRQRESKRGRKPEPEADDLQRREQREREHEDELIDEAGRESFPASDPPAYSPRPSR